MSLVMPIESIKIKGFRSIKSLDLTLEPLNVLIGSNGSGKSNFINYFRFFSGIVNRNLEHWVNTQGGANRILTYGIKETDTLSSSIRFQPYTYDFKLSATVDDRLIFLDENLCLKDQEAEFLGKGHSESKVKAAIDQTRMANISDAEISEWYLMIYHFHDTSETAKVKLQGPLHENKKLASNASNLAAFLYRLKNEYKECYQEIIDTIRLAIPFFDDFILEPTVLSTEEQQIRLLWKQLNSDYELWPSQLSDGSIRFICLVTALLQPDPPSTIIFDEPELGLHPYAVTLLGALFKKASKKMQVIISTQSVLLLNQFNIKDIVVVDREDGVSIFKRLEENKFKEWLEEYTLGELWEKNILGARPR